MTSPSNIVVSGMRPTGKLHLGHYFGVLKNWVQLQETHRAYFFVADWHCLTTDYENIPEIKENSLQMGMDWLAAGLDPKKATLFIQSKVPQHAELHVLFSMITPLGWLERVPSYKELQQELSTRELSTYGFLGYPLLQTADVAIYHANSVPVGADQVAHIELSREIVRRFNHLYKPIFPEPKALLTQAPKLLGMDGRKMSKSYNNSIYLSDSEEEVNKKIKVYMTDPQRKLRADPGNPDVCPIFDFHKLATDQTQLAQINQDCRTAAIGCVDCKKILMKSLGDTFAPFREKRKQLEAKPKEVLECLSEGSKAAQQVAQANLSQARAAMGLE